MNATLIRPRALTHRGVVMASAIWFGPNLCGESELRRRVLAGWESGARLFELEGGALLHFASPRPLRAEIAPGMLLVERDGWLLGAPLSKLEWSEFKRDSFLDSSKNLVLMRGGALEIVAPGTEIDPSEWLDASGWESVEMSALGAVAALEAALAPLDFEARRELAVPASPELAAFLARLRGEEVPSLRPSWQERWKAFLARNRSASGEIEARKRVGESQQKRRFSLDWLFQFRFGASGDSPTLGAGESFSGEFGIIARPTFWLVLLALLLSLLLWPRNGFTFALALFLGVIVALVPVALMAWGLMVVARFLQVPPLVAEKIAKEPAPRASGFPLDLIGLLATCGLFYLFLAQGKWFWAALMLAFAARRAALAQWRRRRLDSRGYSAQSAAPSGGGSRPSKPRKPPSGAWQRWLWRTELGQIFGAQQARYILKMMQMFERGDLDAALRHAVPFNLSGSSATHQSLAWLRARGGLDFLSARGGGGGGGALALPPSIQEQLTKYYRAAFENLANQNRIDEAAFVLAELLDSPAEAVQFLEKHRQWRVAAQLSEVRELEAGLTVRLWWLAGQRSRAIVAARRGNAWADAIARLERGDGAQREGARQLRLLWAQSLALSGDFAGAVEAAWPLVASLPDLRGVVGAWIERGLEGQGSGAARMLGRQAHLLPDLSAETLTKWRGRALQLLDDDEAQNVGLRLQFTEILSSAPPHPLARSAARRAVRALTRDAALHPQWSDELKSKIKILLPFAADGALRTDWTALPFPTSPPTLNARNEPLQLRFEAQDVGAREVFDGVVLPDGRVLVALGEAGAQLWSRGGKISASFSPPCHRLITSPLGERALGVALRGREFRAQLGDEESRLALVENLGISELTRRAGHASLCRFDLTRRTASSWGELADLGVFAPHFDGSQWIITQGDAICALDATSDAALLLWRTGGAGFAQRLAADANSLAILTEFHERAAPPRTEVWRFELPSLTLRERRLVPRETFASTPFLTPSGLLLGAATSPVVELEVSRSFEGQTGWLQVPLGETVTQIEVCASWLAVMSESESGLLVRVFSWHDQNKTLRCKIELCGTKRAFFRLSATALGLSDNRGRFIALDLVSGAVTKNLRLR